MSATSDTIAAVASGIGECAVSLIRVSGPQCLEVLRRVFPSLMRTGSLPAPRVSQLAKAVDPRTGETVDECLVTWFQAPRSYSGEDMLEVGCHGGWVTPQRVLETLFAAGCRPAEPGEFSKRAFLNGKLSLVQAEAVAAVISAKSEQAQRNALRHLEGRLGGRLNELATRLRELTAQLEGTLDFEENEVPCPAPETTIETLAACAEEALTLANTWDTGRYFQEGVRVVLAGKPNVGKSSLMNALLGEPRAIVTDVPHTTRDVIESRLTLDGLPVVLLDTAGLAESRHAVEQAGVQRALEAIRQADVVTLVLDGSRNLDRDDHWCAESVLEAGVPVAVALNKKDLPQCVSPDEIAPLLGDAPVIPTCALTADGIPELLAALKELLVPGQLASPDTLLLTSARQQQALRRCAEAASRAAEAVRSGVPLDMVCLDIRAALHAVGEITGETTTEDLLDSIFSRFCIGK